MPQAEITIPGSRAIVTASGSGIGLQIAEQLAHNDIDVALNDIDQTVLDDAAAELKDEPGDIITITGDASDPTDTERLVEEAVDRFGGVDILVNNVGIAGPTKPCEDITYEEFMQTLEVNLGGHFNAVQSAIPHLRESDAGRIINLSSMSGKRPLERRTPYTTAKMGVIGFVRTLAVELADDDITVNAICPGSVSGPRLDQVIEGQARGQDKTTKDIEEEFRSVSPMNEFVQPTDIADMVLYLCSKQAERITGQDLNVTAGVCSY